MNRKTLLLVLLLMLTLLITADAAEKTDSRLAKKITYFSGYVRLSDALSEISKLSGVTIFAGKSTKDWQVRDMPVVICANDIEVDKLLKLMTDTYYLKRSASEINGTTIYRLYRPKEFSDQLDKYQQATEDYNQQLRDRDVKTLRWAGSLSDADAEKLFQQMGDKTDYFAAGRDPRLAFKEVVMYGKLRSALGEKEMAQLANGETVKLIAGQGGEVGKLIKDYTLINYQILESMRERNNGVYYTPSDPPSASDLEQAHIDFRMSDFEHPDLLSTNISAGSHSGCFMGDIRGFELALPKDVAPPDPESPKVPSNSITGLRELSRNDKLDTEKKYELDRPTGEKLLVADVITAAAKATGYTIIADDYIDHKSPSEWSREGYTSLEDLEKLFPRKDAQEPKKVSLMEIKQALRLPSWHIDEDSKRIVIRDYWAGDYNNLVPRALFEDLLKKVNGPGAELTDFIKVSQLTVFQRLDWIDGVKELEGLSMNVNTSLINWLSRMSDDDLNRAFTTGVPVVSLGADDFTRILNQYSDKPKPTEEINQLMLKITQHDAPLYKHVYTIDVTGTETNLSFPLVQLTFPIYSAEREKELRNKGNRQ